MPRGYRRLGAIQDLARLLTSHPEAEVVVAIGDNFLREKIAAMLRSTAPGVRFGTVVHRSATVSPAASVAKGAVICAGAVVGPGASVGAHAILNTNASLDHHSSLGSFASMAPGSATGGGVVIGDRTHIGMGVMIHHGVTVGCDAVVGSLSLVDKALPDNVVAVGSPARILRERTTGEKYL